MRQLLTLLLATILISSTAKADPDDSLNVIRYLQLQDSVENAMQWKTGKVMINGNMIELNIPKGFKFIDAAQSQFILHDIWGNPERPDVLGMLFPVNGGVFADSSFAFILSYEETGYIKDKDADDIDYADMLKSIQESEAEINKERVAQGYEPIHLLRWAQSPFYDKKSKVLHWAKELKFGDEENHTLNYDVRVLGRRGILSMNAVAGISELGLVKANINDMLGIASFTDGNAYADFDSNTDKVAEYGLGALVAGGILAKTGLLAGIGKFLAAAWKLIIIGIVAIVGGIKKFFGGKKNDDFTTTPTV